ncbi:MAG TPA: alanine--tRNA ligase [Deltaproteobacteria bacterium]|nr:alanine--tRNA ligase [Deltaproteobacteria bacterium]HCP44871.1 alanine--tRNA ligase [Deltaproteobacteria bacterium]
MKVAEIRKAFLNFYAERGHSVVSSSSLVPDNDPTLFFVNAGMVQFKDVFTGAEKRDYSRATTVQKCMRVSGKHNDLENVGFTARHHTLFEMLGNFSFGDYFKEEAIDSAWTFLTEVIGLPKERLLITVFETDDESAELWKALGVPAERIGRCGAKDNFWSMGPTGPCGPCSEIHWDLEEDFVLDNEPDPWGFGHDAGRYMELWNLVFMQYERYEDDGAIKQRDLPRPSVDTGMGLERLAAVAQGHKANWSIDDLQDLIRATGALVGLRYGEDPDKDVSMRVVADHARAAAFLVGDGIMPSNEERGYVLRRILRRAIRHGVKLGIERPFMHEISDLVVDRMEVAYPDLSARRDFIQKVVRNEEETFRETLERGLFLLDDAFSQLSDTESNELPGSTVFELHDTYGFPPDLTQVIAGERGHEVDMAGYEEHMGQQKARSRAAWKGSGEQSIAEVYRSLGEDGATQFLGYQAGLTGSSEICALLIDGKRVDRVEAGQRAELVTVATPFYAESGGQVGDTGDLETDAGRFRVEDTQKPAGPVHVHRGEVTTGHLQVGDSVRMTVNGPRRADIMRNHTATHLLHAALRKHLGTHVQQKGSLVDPSRLRFDFSHFEAIPPEMLRGIEDEVNDQILANVTLERFDTTMDDAVARGAMALFGEKYGDSVRVVEVPGFSTELCGGTHCGATGEIGLLKLTSEGGIASGIRRVEAVTGRGAFGYLRNLEERDLRIADSLKAQGGDTVDRIQRLLDDRKSLKREVQDLRQKLVSGGGVSGGPEAREVAGVQVVATEVEGADARELRQHGDSLLDRLGSGVVVLGSRDGGKATLIVKVSKDLCDRVPAGKLVGQLAELVGGRGGGRPDMAQAGGRNPEGLPGALEKSYELVSAALS